MDDKTQRLTELFRKLGAPNPAGWAHSQVDEGIPQLARFLFLRQAWRHVLDEQDASWVDQWISAWRASPDAPYAGIGRALQNLRAKGATSEELTNLVRGMQAELLFSLCYLLGDPGELEPEVDEIGWGLFRVDPEGKPLEPITGLHESVLETDPSGREMRPRRE